MTTTTTPSPTIDVTDVKAAAGTLVGHAAGYVAYRTVQVGQQHGLFEALADREQPVTADELASDLGLDPLYARVWMRSAHAAGVLELDGDGYLLPAPMAIALLDADHGGHAGPLFGILHQPEIFDAFSARLRSGERLWWEDCSPGFIAAVSATGRPFYNRLVPGGLARVPGLEEVLDEGADVLELASGSGRGLVRMARRYPNCRFVGVDGDAHSVERATALVAAEGLEDRVTVVLSTFEDFRRDGAFDVATINISMHECRDIDLVTGNVLASLRPDGHFVVSDFPFPQDHDTEALRTPGGRVMSGIQFFEALIDDQLLPMSAYTGLMTDAGFDRVDEFGISPVHAIAHGRRPA